MFPFIVADIGGTNARFALATAKQGEQFEIEHINILKGENYSSFEEALAAYIDSLNGLTVRAACVAIAAPIDGDQVSMTNLSWSFSQEAVKQRFGFEAFAAINDYTAVAVATSRLDGHDLLNLIPGDRDAIGNKAVLGSGTGLGVGGLAFVRKGQWLAIPSEGGHTTMAPSTPFEAEVIAAALKRFGYVSAETCLSGPGAVNLYQAISDVHGKTPEEYSPRDVTVHAVENTDSLCREALSMFCAMLGSFSSNLALTYGAKGGVYITGGVVPRFVDFLKASEFEQRFRNRGVMSRYVEDIPVDLVTFNETAYLGAAAWLEQKLS